ncbi:MAG: prolipoprotein diacylglyceryl transferase [Bacillota bacterium]|nr:prolipoprotein diacylglyceryl transferase [Bacillota bacterium]
MRPVLFKVFGHNIYGYGLMMALGIIAAVVLVNYRAKKEGYDEDSILNMAIISIIGGFLGGKILFWITEIKSIIAQPSIILNISNGFVVYGSIIGGALGLIIYAKRKKWDLLKTFDLVIPSLPLAQAIGRIGCFLAGCCYGKETNLTIGVTFKEGSLGPTNIKVLPTEIFSSIFDFLLFIFLIWYCKKERKDGRVFSLYLIIYSIGRFLVEFLRGDPRGFIGSLSTSQFISIFVFVFGIILFNLEKFKKHKKDDMQEG